ncbi:MAG: response regulator transcription factor [Kiloniellaceae bacterium]
MQRIQKTLEDPKILLVEDSFEAVNLIKNTPKDLEITRIFTARNGPEALDLPGTFDAEEFVDVVLCDRNVPWTSAASPRELYMLSAVASTVPRTAGVRPDIGTIDRGAAFGEASSGVASRSQRDKTCGVASYTAAPLQASSSARRQARRRAAPPGAKAKGPNGPARRLREHRRVHSWARRY